MEPVARVPQKPVAVQPTWVATEPGWSVERVRLLLAALVLATVPFLSAPGNLVPDTKFDLVIDPAGFLARALHAWDGQAAFGQLQNQAYGYLWPMGPFFLGGKLAHLPEWVVQRLWWSLLLVVAFAGVVVLLRVVGLARGWPALVAAGSYALAPRIESAISTVSIEAWPMAVLPWVVVPLACAATGRLGIRRAAALSALAVACMGGVNAAAVLATLVLPGLFLVIVVRSWRLIAWWLTCVLLATAWWWIPLIVLGKYAYPFLNYIESAAVTTSVTSGFNDLRGTDQWLAFVIGALGPVWPAGLWLATGVVGVIATAVVAGLGIAGIIRAPRGPIRTWLAVTAVVGLAVLMLGYAGAAGSPVAQEFQQLLDGPLAPFRNIHKFDPLIRLPLTLGLALALTALASRWHTADGASEVGRRRLAGVAIACAVAAVVGVMMPTIRGDLAAPLSFEKVPAAQDQAAAAMAARPGRTLLVPGSAFGEYNWGRPLDEPMQALARSPWAIRNAIPLGAPGATRWLDGVQSLLATGVGQAGLADALRAAGISQLLLRNDLLAPSRTLPGAVVRATLVASPGVRIVAAFGDPVSVGSGVPGIPVGGGKQAPALELFEVQQGAPDSKFVPTTEVRAYVGGPEAATSNAGLGPGAVAVPDLAGGLAPAATVVTDTLRRRALNFGAQVGHGYGPTTTATTNVQGDRPAADVSPYPAGVMETVVRYEGIVGVTASSTAANPFGDPNLGPQYRPFAALAGGRNTPWLSSSADLQPTWTVRLPKAVPGAIHLELWAPGGQPTNIDEVELVTDSGRSVLRPGLRSEIDLKVPGVTKSMQVILHRSDSTELPIGLDDVTIEGVAAREIYEQLAVGDQVSLRVAPGARRACVDPGTQWLCSAPLADPGEELQPLDRLVTLTADLNALPTVQLSPRQGQALETMLDRSMGVAVTGSSRLVDDAAARPGAAIDRDGATAWIVPARDNKPTLTVTFPTPRTITAASAFVDSAAIIGINRMELASGDQRRILRLGKAASAMAPLTGTTFTIAFPRAGKDPKFFKLPAAIRSVNLVGAGLTGLGTTPVEFGCGEAGRVLLVDREVSLAGTITPQQALAGTAIQGRPCTPPVTLPEGSARIRVEPGPALLADSVALLRPAPTTRLVAPEPNSNPHPNSDSDSDSAQIRRVIDEASSPEQVDYQIDAGGSGILTVPQSFNVGWQAQAGGSVLTPVMVAGWQQGWVLPASAAPITVTTEFTGQRAHLGGLLTGALAVILALLLAVLPSRVRLTPAATVASSGVLPSGSAGPPGHTSRGVRFRLVGALIAAAILGGLLADPTGGAIAAGGVLLAWRWRLSAVLPLALLAMGGVLAVWLGRSFGESAGQAVLQLAMMPILGQLMAVIAGLGSGRSNSLKDRPLDEPPGQL